MNCKLLLRVLVLLSALAGCSLNSGIAATIGIDARNGDASSRPEANLATGSDFDDFRAVIAATSNSLIELSWFTETNLTGIDALILRQSPRTNTVYSSEEMNSIHAFVNEGHGLLLLAEGGFSTTNTVENFNALAGPYGVHYGATALHGTGFTVDGLLAHPVTLGATTIGVDFYRPLVGISNPAIDLTLLSDESDILAAVNGVGGSGNVVLLGDTSLWADPDTPSDRNITFADNQLLLHNIISFITAPRLMARRDGNALRLSWPLSVSGYHLQWTESLPSGDWQTLTNQVQTSGDSSFVLDDISALQRYYRLAR